MLYELVRWWHRTTRAPTIITCLSNFILHAFNDAWPYWWVRYLKSYCFTLLYPLPLHVTVLIPTPPPTVAVLMFFFLRVSKYLSPTGKVLEACYTSGWLAPISRCVVLLDWCNYFYSCTFKSTISKHVTNIIKSLILRELASCSSPGIPYTPCELLTWNDCDRENSWMAPATLRNSLYTACVTVCTHIPYPVPPHAHLLLTSALTTFSHRQEVQKICQEMLKCCSSHLSCTGTLHLFFLLCYLHMQIFHCWVASISPLFLPSAPGIMNN